MNTEKSIGNNIEDRKSRKHSTFNTESDPILFPTSIT